MRRVDTIVVAQRTRMVLSFFAILTLGHLIPASSQSQAQRSESTNEVECRWVETAITLDGSATEKAWERASSLVPVCSEHPAKYKTSAKLFWDREYLYFFAEMDDPHLMAAVKEPNGPVWTDDAIALFLKPAPDKSGYFEFQINPAGTCYACFHASPTDKSKPGNTFGIQTVAKLHGSDKPDKDDRGWSVEARIPWIDFLRAGGRPEPNETWTFALQRLNYDKTGKLVETSTFPRLHSPTTFHGESTEEYAKLKFVGPSEDSLSKRFGIKTLPPVTTSRVIGNPDPSPPYRVKRRYPNYSPSYPIMGKVIPGTDQMLLITETAPYAPTEIVRLTDNQETALNQVMKVISFDGVAYDLTFHPRFDENGLVFVGWNGRDPVKNVPYTRITRYRMERKAPYTLDLKSAETIIEWESNGHNGGALCFGSDGMLYVTSGDGTSDSDANLMGQRADVLLAKVLRIDVEHPHGGRPYSIPSDNPFVRDARFRPETWAYGLRNPWRLDFDAATGQLWVGNNGQDQWEQAYLVKPGENYGWSVMEGSHPFYPKRTLGPTAVTPPTVEHSHAEFRSLTGGIIYHGRAFPELEGTYIYGDYSTGRIWAARHDGKRLIWSKEIAQTPLKITGFFRDSQGELLICDHQPAGQGALYTLERMPVNRQPSVFPRKLSESGLFTSVRQHQVVAGAIPYSVNAPFWSDGLSKERYIVLPTGGKIGFTRNRGWNFPDQTVIIKSFAREPGVDGTAIRRWIETRFLTKQQGEWFGYSYAWKEDQSDAELVAAGGMDRDLSPADGAQSQRWHFPSRAECMVCHTRAANFVLGLSTLQMNKNHDYPSGVRDNQLRVLEHLGVMDCDWPGEARQKLHERAQKHLSGAALEQYDQAVQPQANQRAPRPSQLLDQEPGGFSALVNPYDPGQDLTRQARSWLHVNCSMCHVEAGGGNAQMELEFTTPLDKMRIVDTLPLHDSFGLPEAKLLAPGDARRSVLLHRIGLRGTGQMPPLASYQVDTQGMVILRAWINSLK